MVLEILKFTEMDAHQHIHVTGDGKVILELKVGVKYGFIAL